MKLTRNTRNALTLAALGLYSAAVIAACSSDPSASTTHVTPTAGAAGAPAAGAPAAGAPAAGAPAAGAPAAGAPAAGAPAGGSGGDMTAGAPGAGAPSAGSGGAPPPPVAYCDPAATPPIARAPLPYLATTGFIPSGYDSTTLTQIGQVACTDRPAPNGTACTNQTCGVCSKFSYTPATPATYAGVRYQRMFDANYTHPQVCIADGVTYVTFWAKGAVGGEAVTVTAEGAAEVPVVLTAAWKQYQIPMTGVTYNTFASGVEMGFYWKVVPPVGGTAVAETFSIDDIVWGTTAAGGGGGTGGAGGGGGAGGTGGGAGHAGTGGTGGTSGGGTGGTSGGGSGGTAGHAGTGG